MKFYTVFFKKAPNYNITHWQNQNIFMGSRVVHSLEEAIAMMKDFEVLDIVDNCGRFVYTTKG